MFQHYTVYAKVGQLKVNINQVMCHLFMKLYAKVGQLKVNINQVMCHLFMKLFDTFDQNPLCTFDKKRGKSILMKNALMA